MEKLNTHVIWGAGAMGGIMAAYWARQGMSVTCVDNNRAHVKAIAENGIKITGPIEEFTQPLHIITPEQAKGPLKKVYLATKSVHTAQAVQQIVPLLAPDGYIVSWQNGLNEDYIAAAAGQDRTIGSFINFSADVAEPGVIHFGGRGTTVVGELDGRTSDRIQRLHEHMKIFNPDSVLTDNIFGYLWSKIEYGSMLFAEATSNRGITEMFEMEKWHDLLIGLGHEIVAVARAEGIRLLPFNGFDPKAFEPGAGQAAGRASLEALAEHKRKTEVDTIMGAVIPKAEKHGIDIPLTRQVIDAVHKIESGKAVQNDFHMDQMALAYKKNRA
ncbi:MAG: ketopantoate reductase family protein [Desulfobacter sp.]|nr:ketopantoate reductase family protein [Desulfobacter sp.]